MALYKLRDFDSDYRASTDGDDIMGLDVYSQDNNEKIGSVQDVLVDEEGRFRYLVVDTGFWVFGKRVMLPIGLTRIDYNTHRVHANLTKERVENLPEFNDDLKLDRQYEERVRDVYRPSRANASVVNQTAPLNTSFTTPGTLGVNAATVDNMTPGNAPLAGDVDPVPPVDSPAIALERTNRMDVSDRDPFPYYEDASMYEVNEQDHQSLKLYQERLVANKQRVKAGEVAVGKRVQTETQHVSVPVEKERIIVERTDVSDVGREVTPGAADFQEGEVARLEVYEEVADIHKEAYVREEVQVRKETKQEVVDQEATIRREELDIKTDGNPVIDRRS